jgi:hypothetical protein
MTPTIHLDFDPYNPDHRRIAEWLMAQPDPAEAVVRLVRAAGAGQSSAAESQAQVEPEIEEDPESARRLDSIFEQGAK